VATAEGWLSPKGTSFGAYLAVVIDPFSRQVVGWSMHPHMRAESDNELCKPHDVREELGRNPAIESDLTVFIV
jgi:transposase InsO family protein